MFICATAELRSWAGIDWTLQPTASINATMRIVDRCVPMIVGDDSMFDAAGGRAAVAYEGRAVAHAFATLKVAFPDVIADSKDDE